MSQCPKKTKKKTNKNPIKLKKYSASEKLEIIERRENGDSWIKIAQHANISTGSQIQSILSF